MGASYFCLRYMLIKASHVRARRSFALARFSANFWVVG